jgi:hypothetical protein
MAADLGGIFRDVLGFLKDNAMRDEQRIDIACHAVVS